MVYREDRVVSKERLYGDFISFFHRRQKSVRNSLLIPIFYSSLFVGYLAHRSRHAEVNRPTCWFCRMDMEGAEQWLSAHPTH